MRADPTTSKRFRNPEDAVGSEGRAFQLDSTCSDVSIFKEPLVPIASVTSPQDCIFGQAQPFLASALGSAALLARTARTLYCLHTARVTDAAQPKQEILLLRRALSAFYSGGDPPEGCSHYLAASAAVFLNSIFVSGHEMATMILLDAHAKAPALCAKKIKCQIASGESAIGAALPSLVPPNALAEAQAFWAPFEREDTHKSAWTHLEPLLVLLAETNGSYDLGLGTLECFGDAIDRLLRQAAWFHASPDGANAPTHPSPLAGVRSFTQVRSEHVTPIFVGSSNALGHVLPARGALLGCVGMQFQQLLALLTAAATDDEIVVNAAQNFSYLTFRPSAAPDILTSKLKPRSAKAISPVNVEGDESAYGTRDDKLRTCKLHRAAWKTNLDLVLPICSKIAAPRTDAERSRGDLAQVDYVKNRKRQLDLEGLLTRQEMAAAKLFATAASLVDA